MWNNVPKRECKQEALKNNNYKTDAVRTLNLHLWKLK